MRLGGGNGVKRVNNLRMLKLRMSARRWLSLSAIAFSVFSCASPGPDIASCVSDPPNGLQCVPRRANPVQDPYTVPYEETGNYFCMPPDDAAILIEWIKRHSSKKQFNAIQTELIRRGIYL